MLFNISSVTSILKKSIGHLLIISILHLAVDLGIVGGKALGTVLGAANTAESSYSSTYISSGTPLYTSFCIQLYHTHLHPFCPVHALQQIPFHSHIHSHHIQLAHILHHQSHLSCIHQVTCPFPHNPNVHQIQVEHRFHLMVWFSCYYYFTV